jgi:hypothetical protein
MFTKDNIDIKMTAAYLLFFTYAYKKYGRNTWGWSDSVDLEKIF